jgi:hypothetical protein
MVLMNDLIKKYSESDDYGEYSKNKKLWENISECKEIEKFMSSAIAGEVLKKYSIPVQEKQYDLAPEVDFEKIKLNVEIHSKGVEFYNELKKKLKDLGKSHGRKIDTIISSIVKYEDLSEDILQFENELMLDIRKKTPELFDQINTPQNYLLESTLKFIILRYNQAIDKSIDLKDFFQAIEKKSALENNKYASVYNKIAANLSNGIAPTIKEISLASNYFTNEAPSKDSNVNVDEQNINLNLLRQMVEWDSRMKILTQGERTYLAD